MFVFVFSGLQYSHVDLQWYLCFFFVLLSFAGVAVPEQEAIDPYDLIEAVEILSKLPKDFYENLVCIHDSGDY